MIANTFGIKGKGAATWLAAQGLGTPEQPNTWTAHDGSQVLRLGRGEYLVDGEAAMTLRAAWQNQPASDAYLVPRYDAGFAFDLVSGRKVLPEICALDTRPEVMGNSVLMTSAAGISVTLVCDENGYRLWCDATYGDYLQQVLQKLGI